MVVIDKPAGFHVHPPEALPEKVPREKIVLANLRAQLGKWVFPIHRLDVGTSGILAMALDAEAARLCAQQFQNQTVQKTYWAVVRGFTPLECKIDLDLESEKSDEKLSALTVYRTLQTLELSASVGKRFPTARYSWVQVHPKSGRFHQIRRHMNRISHPVIGDGTHGDSRHNKFFRDQLGIKGLCLRAVELKMELPWLQEMKAFSAPENLQWQKIEALFAAGGAGSGGLGVSQS